MPERELIDPSDGENIAVRSFLAMYGARGLTTPEMRAQMTAAGFPHWPEWADSDPGRLTKHGAQDWLRHLFALETAALAQPVAAEPSIDDRKDAERYRALRKSVGNPVYCAQSTQYGVRMIHSSALDDACDELIAARAARPTPA